jgi:hypothetical protein
VQITRSTAADGSFGLMENFERGKIQQDCSVFDLYESVAEIKVVKKE